MRFIAFLLLVGCTNNKEIYTKTQEYCPVICEKWTGHIKANPDAIECVCKELGL